MWETKQSALLAQCRAVGTQLTIGGDGRADSPGHPAKYGSYGIIDLITNKVIDMQLVQVILIINYKHNVLEILSVQSNEVKSSNHMEKEGLARALDLLSANSLEVGTLITDRHSQISKFVGKQLPAMEHCYDVWHISKGLLVSLVLGSYKNLTSLCVYRDKKSCRDWLSIRTVTW